MSQHSKLYNCTRWRKLRAEQLRKFPLCAYCLKRGKAVEATVCDHVHPHRGDLVKFWSGPFSSLCSSCHSGAKQEEEKSGTLRGGDVDGNPLDANHHWYKEG